ncbi:hypothetical protein F5Y10DRAFT_242571 [Nemania abortiva]|nr:hypothetical protein F5Y10DRAFT_242571 [Nemania abortiva]
MAEAFGIAASVAGIVSLGLELSARITEYVDTIRRRDEEINAIRRQTKNFQGSLDILREGIPDLSLKYQIAGNTVLAALESVELELKALKDFTEKLMDPAGQPQSLKSNFKHAKKKILFPIHQGTLKALQQRLDGANSSLNAATRALSLIIVSSINESSSNALTQLSSLGTTSTVNNATSSSIKASLDIFIPQVNEALLEIKASLGTNTLGIQRGYSPASTYILKQQENSTGKIWETKAEFREDSRKTPQEINLPGISPAEDATLLMPKLLSGDERLSDILDGMARQKENDPPHLLDMTVEQRALYRLVSSPAQLEKLCTLHRDRYGVEHEFTMEQRDTPKPGLERTPGYMKSHSLITNRYMPHCICRQKYERLHRQAKMGDLSVDMLSSVRWKHLPECRYAKSEVLSKSNSIHLSYRGLRWLLSKAVDVSISLSTGSGGLSISPNITIRPMVDETRAPVFRSLKFLHDSLERQFGPLQDEFLRLRLLEEVVHRILHQYRSQNISPYEVDSKGQSVMHYWVDVMSISKVMGFRHEEVFTAMTKLLLEAGLPAFLCDDQGASPGTRLIKRDSYNVFSFKRLLPILYEEAPEASIFEKYWLNWTRRTDWNENFFKLLNRIEEIEILGCGPLSSAILLRKEAEVKSIIALYPSTLHEQNLIRQTPFHFTADKPRMLRLLMAAASAQELNTPDSNGDYALDYALRLTSALCSEGSSWVACTGCPCIECVEIFLASGWRCRFDFLEYCGTKMSHTARIKIIDHLVSKRALLKELGQKFLPFSDIERHQLNEHSVLDNHAHRVAELLLQDGISIPASVRATLQVPEFGCCGYHCTPMGRTLYCSVYHNAPQFNNDLPDQLADFLYEKGFHDIDQVNTHGLSPLSHCILNTFRNPLYILWLIDHGANILQPFPVHDRQSSRGYSYSTHTAAQFILYNPRILYESKSISKGLPHARAESYRRLVSLVAPMDQHDDCRCQCIETGCHTMKVFFKHIWQITTSRRGTPYEKEIIVLESISFPDIGKKISNLFKSLSIDLSEWERVTRLALRYFTFETLGLQHTCCELPKIQPEWSEEEIMEIEDENREKLDLLELLLQDFQIAYGSFESQDGQGDRFTNFITAVWSPKIQQVLADMETFQLTANDKLKAEEIGVRWEPALDNPDMGELEHLLKKLDGMLPAKM